MPSGQLKKLSQKVRQYESVEFLQVLGFVKTFKVIGPFGCKSCNSFSKAFPPEKEIDFGAGYPGSTADVHWQTYSIDTDGYLNFLNYLAPSDWVCAYAYCKVTSPQAVSAQIRLGSNDTVTLWFNGEKILSKNVERSAAPDSDILPIQLKEGENTILVKVCNTELNWGMYLRITDEAGDALKNLAFWP